MGGIAGRPRLRAERAAPDHVRDRSRYEPAAKERHLLPTSVENEASPNLTRRRRASRPGSRLLAALLLSLVAVGVANALASVGYGLWVHDEGIEAMAGLGVAEGRLLYRDLYYEFPPAAPYALALVFKLFGPSLLALRFTELALALGAVLVAAYLAFRLTPGRWLVVSVAVLSTAILRSMEIALPVTGAMFWLLLGTLVSGRALRRGAGAAAACGALMGLGAAWRLDLGAYFIAGSLGLMMVRGISARRGIPAEQSALLEVKRGTAFCLGAITVLALTLGRFIAIAPGQTYQCLAALPRVVAAYRDLPSPSPVIVDWHHVSALAQVADPWTEIALRGALYMPVLVGLGLVVGLAFASGPKGVESEASGIKTVLVLSGIGLLMYGTVRCDLTHLWPLTLVGAGLAPGALASLAGRSKDQYGWRMVSAHLLLALLVLYTTAYTVAGAAVRLREMTDQRRGATVVLPTPRGRGIHVTPQSEYAPLVQYLLGHVPPGGYLFVGAPTHTWVRSSDTLLYFLSGRRPATKWYQFDPGVTTTPWVQEQIVADLERTSPPVVVIDFLSSYLEPGGRPTGGARMLDRYLALHYREVRRFGRHIVFERCVPSRPTAPATGERPSKTAQR